MDALRWNVTDAEHAAAYPCDGLVAGPRIVMTRGMDVAAPVAVVFRWLCQIKVAPYSYDLIDNLGRRSPRTLTPGADQLAVGQRFGVVFRIVSFEPDGHITAAGQFLGPTAMTYLVRPTDGGTRLLARLAVRGDGAGRRVLGHALAAGDLVMMRKQLLTLKGLAEGQSTQGTSGER